MARKQSKITDTPKGKVLGKAMPARNVVHKVGRWLQSTDTPRWWLIVGIILAPLVSIGTTLVADGFKRAEDLRTQQVQSLVDSMTQFYVQAVAFSNQVQDTKVATSEMRGVLTKNLGEQFARLNLVEPLIPADQRMILQRYRETVLKMQETLQSVAGPEQLGRFFSDANNLLVARNRLNEVLLKINGGRLT